MNHDKVCIPSDPKKNRRTSTVYVNTCDCRDLQVQDKNINRRSNAPEELGDSKKNRRNHTVYLNPTYDSTDLQVQDKHISRRLKVSKELGDSKKDRRTSNIYVNSCDSTDLPVQDKHLNRRSNVPEELGYSPKDRRTTNVYVNPTYDSTDSLEQQKHISRSFHDPEDFDRLSHREIIRNTIQAPTVRRGRKRSLCHCKLLLNENKKGRLFIAYVLLTTLFVMTFGSMGLSIIFKDIQLTFFPEFWKITIILATLTLLIGVYICWEDGIAGQSRRSQGTLQIRVEQMQEFAANR